MPTGGMPSRSRLVMLAGDPRIAAFGRMSRTNKLRYQGDPFLGGIIRAIGGGLGFLAKKVIAPALGISAPIPSAPMGPPPPLPPSPITGPGTIISGPISEKIGPIIERFKNRTGAGGISKLPPSGFFPPFGAAGTGFRRRRRMNPLNPRALRRALSRAGAFAKFARRALRVTFGKTPKVRFKVGRRKRT